MGVNLKTITIITLMFGITALQAQLSSLDSLELSLKLHQNEDTTKVILLNDVAYNYYKKDINKTFTYANKAYQLADKLNYVKGKAQALKIKGIYFDIKSEYAKAIEYYQQSLQLFEQLNDLEGVSASNHNIGVIYKIMGDYEQALSYYKKSLRIEQALENKRGTAISYYTIANIYIKQEKFDIGLEYYHKALQLFDEMENKSEIATCLNNIGIVHYKQKDLTKAEELFKKSLELSIEINEKFIEAPNHIELGKLNLKKGHPLKAYQSGQKAMAIANELGALKLRMESAALLAKSSKILRKYKEALIHHELFKKLNDSLINEDRIRKVTAMEYQYRFNREKQSILLEQEKKEAISIEKAERERIIRNMLLTGSGILLVFIAVILYAFILKRKANIELKEQKREIEDKNEKLSELNKEIKEQARSLKDLNATKDKFFSIIAHDLKSPFSSVFGLSEMLLEEHKEMELEKRHLLISRLFDSSKQVYKLLENLLTWSHLQRGALITKVEPFKICDLINGVIILLHESIKRKEIVVKSNCTDELKIFADKNMIETILRNLLSNAIKFTPKGGEITISVEPKEDKGLKVMQFSVRDNGVGIHPDVKCKLFRVAENKATLGTEKETGSGLGLILCKEFVGRHKGRIWVESELDKGSTFYFTIPQ